MIEIREVPQSVSEEIKHLESVGLNILGLHSTTLPRDVVAAITSLVRERNEAGRPLSEGDEFALGALLGQQYVRGLNWHWGAVVWDADEENGAIGVLNQDESLFNNPIGWMSKVCASDGGVTFLLSYNMIDANMAPISPAGSATPLY
jgi:hypothetical protein